MRNKLLAIAWGTAWLTLLATITVAQTTVISGSGGAATSVSAAAFPLRAPDGTAAAPSYSFSVATGHGLFRSSSGLECISFTGEPIWCAHSAATQGWTNQSDLPIGWTASTTTADAAADTCLERVAAGVTGACGAGTAATGWIQNEEGDQFLTANATNATITPANLTDLTTNVTNARKYAFQFVAQLDNSTDTDGIRFDFDGGTATATDFRVTCKSFNNNLTTLVTTTTALATDITEATYAGVGSFECAGSFEPSSTGTFIPRFATNTAVSGTLTAFRGSYLLTKDMP